jgi:hypothetical protein
VADKFVRRPRLAIGVLVLCISLCLVGGLPDVVGAKASGQQNGALAALLIILMYISLFRSSCVIVSVLENR